ncbi:uncharacterized protein [Anoplolepis gracilipes]|uniref:uncharacterized protein isoform X2 n=1 Tax=Anoplolepis gracilipes TaxID=354296 RepID=UPI003BA13B4C
MGYSLMAICVLVALVLARFVYGRPAVDKSGLNLNMLESHGNSKLEDLSIYELNAVSSLAQGSSIPAKLREKRSSDHRLAELETLLHLLKISIKRSLNMTEYDRLDPTTIGRRRRFAVNEIPMKLVLPTHHVERVKFDGDPAYPLIS